ncbi:26S proteasome non-ATPase regulatory subunit 4 [Tanacetum coccineum]
MQKGARVDTDHMSILDALRRADEFLGNDMMYKRIVVFAGGPVYWFKGQLIGIGTNLKEKGVVVDVINFGDKDRPRSPILSRTLWEHSSSLESINTWQKAQIDALTQENENLKRELEFFRTESLRFSRRVQDHDARNW